MKYLQTYKIFERKGNYQLFHKTSSLESILKDGYIKCGGGDNDDCKFWNTALRKSVLPHWKENDTKFKTISATRNLNYLGLPALELDVEKISDKYRIIPFSENPDFYLDFEGKPAKTKLGRFQNQLRSKDKNVGKLLWRVKTDKSAMDFGIAEELILTDKLDVSKYVKRIILKKDDKYGYYNNKKIKEIVKNKYPHIEVVEIGSENYADVNKELSKITNKEKVLTELFNGGRITNSLKQDIINAKNDWNELMSDIVNVNYSHFLKLLNSNKYNLEETDINGNTALLLAAKEGRLKMVKQLIKAGANIFHTNNDNENFYDLSLKKFKFINIVKDWIEKNYPEVIMAKKYNL